MNIKKSTINEYIRQVEVHLVNNNYKAALDIAAKYPLKKGYIICQSRALSEFIVQKENLLEVNHVQKDNPHYKLSSNMRIFLVAELESLFVRKHKRDKIQSTPDDLIVGESPSLITESE
jgi:hypothetical protein